MGAAAPAAVEAAAHAAIKAAVAPAATEAAAPTAMEAAIEAGVSNPTAALAYAAIESNQTPILEEARSYSNGGVSGVPYFFINEQPSGSGAMSPSSFKELLEKASCNM